MRKFALALSCGVVLFAGGCSTSPATNNANSAAATGNTPASRTSNNAALPPVSSAHGGSSTVAPPATTNAPAANSSAKPGIDTAALDAKIESAEAKAKSGNQADKLAAAAALVARGNVYRDAGQPSLYKFALGDYRRALRYQPENSEAREKMNEIVSIYQSMGRPVPENGNEP
jgi:hypothetical protein